MILVNIGFILCGFRYCKFRLYFEDDIILILDHKDFLGTRLVKSLFLVLLKIFPSQHRNNGMHTTNKKVFIFILIIPQSSICNTQYFLSAHCHRCCFLNFHLECCFFENILKVTISENYTAIPVFTTILIFCLFSVSTKCH